MSKKRKGIRGRISHDTYLDDLVTHLEDIGENRKHIKWIMKDGIWMSNKSYEHNQLCDLIVVYYDGYGIPIELKGSSSKRPKALKQIFSGKKFITNELGLDCPYGKIVIYNHSRLALFDQRFKHKNIYRTEKVNYR